jgi:hypothetical protein
VAQRAHRGLRLVAAVGLLVVAFGPLALQVAAASQLTMSARILLQGHARSGSWAAVEVELQNDGPAIQGELRMDGGTQGTARFAMAVDLPTGSHKTYVLHAQPPPFGRTVKVSLVSGEQVVDSVDVAYLVHEATQLVVGVVAERPQAILSEINLPPNPFGAAAALIPLGVADLPERSEGWGVLDRLIWQDVDTNQLSTDQLTALRQWVAAGGRLIIVGGSAGIGTLSALPDDLLPYRPTATVDLDPSVLTALIGPLPGGATQLPAMAGALAHGRTLVSSGDRTVAAEVTVGSGRVTVFGFDPTTKWLAESKSVNALWSAALPARSNDGSSLVDDSQLVQAAYQLPLLALPPTTGLLLILGAYILIIGPINYLILRRLDRRELAWVTMPVLVLTFAAASFGYGFLLRGTDVVVNEVAVVRGAPDATEATAQVYFGVFSPTRSTYRVDLPQGALLASPINGDPFGLGTGTLDIVQGTGPQEPSAVRNLTVGSGSLRVVRAELPVSGPRMRGTLRMEGINLSGTFENASDKVLENVAVVLGSSVAVLGDVQPGAKIPVRLSIRDNPFGASLADQVVGQPFDSTSADGARRQTRYQMVNQLVSDPMGTSTALASDHAVVLAFGRDELLDVRLGGESPRRNGNVLYFVPVDVSIKGQVTFSSDLLRSTVLDGGALFSKDRFFMNLGQGSATLAYRPIPFDGRFGVAKVRLVLGQGGGSLPQIDGEVIEPLASVPEACTDVGNSKPAGCKPRRIDFLPEVEVFDLVRGDWARLPRLKADGQYSLADPSRYVDAGSGQILVRFLNDNPEGGAGFSFQLALIGAVE